jgi:hypothetical protein
MFSRRERDFLEAILQSESTGDKSQRALLRSFPNPIYRRKLLWGIRQKAGRAAADWELYVRAARTESRVVPGPTAGEAPPLVQEPFVQIGRSVRSLLTRPRHLRSRSSRGPPSEAHR